MQPAMIGKTLQERYQIESPLGSGGMAEVYLAFDTKLKRKVVVKIPHPELGRSDAIKMRFRSEVTRLADVQHPYVLGIQDSGEHEGRPFAVVSYQPGGSLEDRLEKSGRVQSPEEILGWLKPMAAALDFIHDRGAIHRDVKPANILFDASDHACLADFGIAKAIGEANTDGATVASPMTELGTVVGTPDYMPPESIDAVLTPAYDQYSLATMAYLSLSGQLPYRGPTPQAVLAMKKTEDPPALPRALPRGVSRAVMRGMDRDPTRRHESCRALAAAFERGIAEGGGRDWRRPTLLALGAAGALAVALLGFQTLREPLAEGWEELAIWWSESAEPTPDDAPATQRGAVVAGEGADIAVPAARAFGVGSTPAEIDRALALCGRWVGNCRREWYQDETLRRVDVGGFRIGAREVTVADFEAFVRDTGHSTTAEREGTSYIASLPMEGLSWRHPDIAGRAAQSDHAVVHVSHADAEAYCESRGGRLPSEAEWELAARGAERRVFPWGNEWDLQRLPLGRAGDRPLGGANPRAATPLGVDDLAGGVWEWTGTRKDGGIVLKGGSFMEKNPANLRAAARMVSEADFSSSDIGFRCVRDR